MKRTVKYLSSARSRSHRVIFLAVLIGGLATLLHAQTADGETPAQETVCDDAGFTAALWGLCNAYCEAMDCDHEKPQASATACDRILANFHRFSGGQDPPCVTPDFLDLVDFRGSNPCPGGDGDQVVLGSQETANNLVVIPNTSSDPLEIIDIQFSDPQFFTSVSLPFTISAFGQQPVLLSFRPDHVGVTTAMADIFGATGGVGFVDLIGEGLPNDAPVLGGCDTNPNPAIFGQAVTTTLEVSDSATLANIVSCTATGVRIAGGTPLIVVLNLVDDGSTPDDVPCDGIYTRTQATGGLFSRGTWEFTYECFDKQGNVSTGPICVLLIGTDTDGDGLEDSIDPCPLDPLNQC